MREQITYSLRAYHSDRPAFLGEVARTESVHPGVTLDDLEKYRRLFNPNEVTVRIVRTRVITEEISAADLEKAIPEYELEQKRIDKAISATRMGE
jgi:hypothetical protein